MVCSDHTHLEKRGKGLGVGGWARTWVCGLFGAWELGVYVKLCDRALCVHL